MRVDDILDDNPAIPIKIEMRIADLEIEINDLINENQTNHLVLKWLVNIFNAHLIQCKSIMTDSNAQESHIVSLRPNSDAQKSTTISMRDLPLIQKRLIYLCSGANTILLRMLAIALKTPYEDVARDVCPKIFKELKSKEDFEIEEFIEDFVAEEIDWRA